jgi:hypothetical protein
MSRYELRRERFQELLKPVGVDMLIVTPQQMQALSRDMFNSWMVEHLAEFFGEETAALDEDEIRERISAAVERARQHGFQNEVEWCRYVDLSFVLGPAFDQDPDLPWVSEILSDGRVTSSAMRMELLYEAAQDHCAETIRRGSIEEGSPKWAS